MTKNYEYNKFYHPLILVFTKRSIGCLNKTCVRYLFILISYIYIYIYRYLIMSGITGILCIFIYAWKVNNISVYEL